MPLVRTCLGKLTLSWVGPRCLYSDEVAVLPSNLGGVYVLMAFVPSSPKYCPYYVGQTASAVRRLGEHMSSPKLFLRRMQGSLRTYFTFARISDRLLRTAAEAALIRELAPVGNDEIPFCPIEVTVNPPPTWLLND